MIYTASIKNLRELITSLKKKGKVIGFVPTMGALHNGHISLVKGAKKECDFVVVSIFVNPLQFGPNEDYKCYPRTLKEDKKLLLASGADLLFYPKVEDIYQVDQSTTVTENRLSGYLCAKTRPTHFRGVCTVVAKLFNIVNPDIAYFGQKDYQQALIIKRMTLDLFWNIKIKVLPIVRENDGLAMSSRNRYLSPLERSQANSLYQALKGAKNFINTGERNISKIKDYMTGFILANNTAKIDYIEILNADNLLPLNKLSGRIVIALAVFIGKTRLIDNIVLNIKK